MNLPFLFARRYLFSRKRTNAINIITGIAMLGIGVGTAALILVLSVFNGFESLLSGLMNSMNADVKIVPAQGKTFTVDSAMLEKIRKIPGVGSLSLVLEETALLEYDGNQDFCTLKGVDDHYSRTTTIDSAMANGKFVLHQQGFEYLILGGGIAHRLNIDTDDPFTAVAVYMPKQQQRGPADQPFTKSLAYPAGTFSIKQDYDYQYVFCSLDFIRRLLNKPDQASLIEADIRDESSAEEVLDRIREITGDVFVVQDRYEQNASLFRLMKIEKWLSYAIAGLALAIVSFNLIGALWMIVLDKKQDISILKSMGATMRQVRDIILLEGTLICTVGIGAGIFVALIAYTLQKQFGLVGVPEGFVVDAYPIVLRWPDFLVVTITVLTIGLLASLLPARKGSQVPAYLREE
jgi:lipoprotein-releasing system permease protein